MGGVLVLDHHVENWISIMNILRGKSVEINWVIGREKLGETKLGDAPIIPTAGPLSTYSECPPVIEPNIGQLCNPIPKIGAGEKKIASVSLTGPDIKDTFLLRQKRT